MSSEFLVRVPHREPYEVARGLFVKETKWPMPGMTVPVMVDRDDETHMRWSSRWRRRSRSSPG